MKPLLSDIIKTLTGYYEVGVLYPPGRLYTYKLTSARDVERVRFYASKGYTNRLIKLIKTKEVLR